MKLKPITAYKGGTKLKEYITAQGMSLEHVDISNK